MSHSTSLFRSRSLPRAARREHSPKDAAEAAPGLRIKAWHALDRTIRQAEPSGPAHVFTTTDEAEVARLTLALRRERLLGRAGHWAYDINRHIALRQALCRIGAIDRRKQKPETLKGSG